MGSYLVRRFGLMLLTLFGISVIIFLMLRLAPGNIADILFDAAGFVDPAEKAKIMEDLGLDKPLPVQYAQWIGGLLQAVAISVLMLPEAIWGQVTETLPEVTVPAPRPAPVRRATPAAAPARPAPSRRVSAPAPSRPRGVTTNFLQRRSPAVSLRFGNQTSPLQYQLESTKFDMANLICHLVLYRVDLSRSDCVASKREVVSRILFWRHRDRYA